MKIYLTFDQSDDTLTYDPAGNRVRDERWEYVYNTRGQLEQKRNPSLCTNGKAFLYDEAGNQTEEGRCSGAGFDRRMEYDAANRMVAMTSWREAGSVAAGWEHRTFRYDALGRRIVMRSDSLGAADWGTWRYWWLGDQVAVKTYNVADGTLAEDMHEPMMHRDSSGASGPAWTLYGSGEWFFYGPGTDNVLASWNYRDDPGGRHLFVPDYRGSIVNVTKADGSALGRAADAYTPFGTPQGEVASGGAGSPGFNGQEANGGLVYMRNRWYDPNTGRFTQEDPIGFAGGVNLYAYAGNDPVTYSDPFGLCPVTPQDPTPCSVAYAVRGGAYGFGFGVGLVGASAIPTLGGSVVLSPAIIPASTAIGATGGALVGAVTDKKAEISTAVESIRENVRKFIVGVALALSTSTEVPTTPTNPCGDSPPPEQTSSQADPKAPSESTKVIRIERNDRGCK